MLRGEPAFEAALAGSHNAVVRCEAWIAGRRVASDVPLTDGSVTADSDSFVRRTSNLTFVEDTSAAAQALGKTLAQPGCEIRVWRGARIGDATRVLPIHWGRVQRPRWEWPGRRIQLTSPDLAVRISLDRFPRPRSSQRGFTVAEQIKLLVRETLPRVRFVDESEDATAVAAVVWDRDRNDAITKLATSIGCETYFRPDGSWVLRRIPTLIGIAPFRVRQGVSLVDASIETDWDAVRNHIVARSDRADGVSLYGESIDNDPNSPTYILGPLGRQIGFYASSLFTTKSQCERAAAALRARMSGARVSVNYSALAHPGIEAGDRHDVSVDGATHRIVLDSFSLPIFGGEMTGQGRSARPVEDVQ